MASSPSSGGNQSPCHGLVLKYDLKMSALKILWFPHSAGFRGSEFSNHESSTVIGN